jgi:hypothetical protein
LFKIAPLEVSLWHFHVYMYYGLICLDSRFKALRNGLARIE